MNTLIHDIYFISEPDLKNDEKSFITFTVDIQKVIESFFHSVFAYEWMHTETGSLKSLDELASKQKNERIEIENMIKNGHPIPQPILGIGLMDHIEIGTGKAIIMTLAAHGVKEMPVHIPISMFGSMRGFSAVQSKHRTEKGNVFFYILLAVVLLGALSYAISSSSRHTSTGTITDGQAKLFAAEMIHIGSQVKDATAKLLLRGCTDTQISIENDNVSGYANAGAPSDESCHIFHVSSGGMQFPIAAENINDGTNWFFTGAAVAHQNGGYASTNVAGNADLVMMLFGVPENVCTQINNRLGISGIPVDDGAYASTTKFQGSYTAAEDINGLPDAAQPSPCASPSTSLNLCGRMSGCFREEGGSQRYVFMQVLIQR